MTRVDLLPQDHASTDASWLVLVLACVVLVVCFSWSALAIVTNARRWWAIRRAARGELPAEGREGVLLGKVALAPDDEGEGPPVVAEMTFEHHDVRRQKGQVARHWTASPLETRARPFDLVLASGERVRVEPGTRVRLLDTLEIIEGSGPVRVKAARLSVGEEAQIAGRIELRAAPGDGYRGAAKTRVLRPPGDGDGEQWMASHDALLQAATTRVGGHTFWLVAFFVVAALVRAAAGDFLRLHREGKVVEAVALTVESEQRKNKNNVYYLYFVTATHPDAGPVTLRGEVHSGKLDELLGEPLPVGKAGSARAKEGIVVPFRLVPGAPTIHVLGTRAAAGEGALFAQGLLATLSLIAFAVARMVMKPWWEKSSHDYVELLSSEEAKVPLVRRPAADEDE